jgi:hypothetical protein
MDGQPHVVRCPRADQALAPEGRAQVQQLPKKKVVVCAWSPATSYAGKEAPTWCVQGAAKIPDGNIDAGQGRVFGAASSRADEVGRVLSGGKACDLFMILTPGGWSQACSLSSCSG